LTQYPGQRFSPAVEQAASVDFGALSLEIYQTLKAAPLNNAGLL
jgi:hypothetical protein